MDVKAIFNEALEKNVDERAAYLDLVCARQPDLRARVEALLVAFDEADSFLEQKPNAQVSTVAEVTADYTHKELTSNIIAGKYKIREKLGEGGMGSVYVVETFHDVKAFFALKLIKPGYDSRSVLARFEQERQALALMNHPNIARFVDAGATETGQPFFVMELIKGMPITEFCDHEKLTVEQRIELFKPICQAVQHAHQKGIIHRDLKPSNILVALYDGLPIPKVIDFGVAKATMQPLTDKSIYSEVKSVIGTLEYMSPEQAEVNSLDIDTRADIYSLGVILYELLTGMVPFSRNELKAAGFLRMLEIIRDEEPAKPSTKISSSGSLPSVAATRKIEPRALTRKLQGELDWIVMKCLSKERNRRYEGPNQLAQDLENYLANLPVMASPPSTAYRLKKFLNRHRGKVAAAGVIVVCLIGGIIGTTWGMVKALRANEESIASEQKAIVSAQSAKREAEVSRSLAEYMENELFNQIDPEERAKLTLPMDKDIKLRSILDHSTRGISQRFEKSPHIEAALRFTIGKAYLSLGMYESAQVNLETALMLHIPLHGEAAPATLAVKEMLGEVLHGMGRLQEAERYYEQVAQQREKSLGRTNEATMRSRYLLASLDRTRNRFDNAITCLRGVLADQQQTLPAGHVDILRSMRALADIYRLTRKDSEAEALLTETLQISREALTVNHPATLATMNNLAQLYRSRNKLEKAGELYDELIQAANQVYDKQHPNMLLYKNNQAVCYVALKKLDQAEAIFLEVLPSYQTLLGPEHKNTLIVQSNIGSIRVRKGDSTGALTILKEILPKFRKQFGNSSISTIIVMEEMSKAYLLINDNSMSYQLQTEILSILSKQTIFDEIRYIRILNSAIRSKELSGSNDEIVKLLKQAIDIRSMSNGTREKLSAQLQSINKYGK